LRTDVVKWLRAALFVCVAAATACRQDMQDQPKYTPLRESTFFSNAQSARPVVADTVARSQLNDDPLLFTGKDNSRDATMFPFPVDAAVM